MQKTKISNLLLLGTVSLLLMFFIEQLLVSSGGSLYLPPLLLSLTLVVMGLLLFIIALPIRSAIAGKPGAKPIDPFVAVRVALLAKASSLGGSIFLGAGLGASIFLLTRPVINLDALWLTLALAGCALVLVVAAFLAESFCILPPDKTQEPES